jgi:hypothetical protein
VTSAFLYPILVDGLRLESEKQRKTTVLLIGYSGRK